MESEQTESTENSLATSLARALATRDPRGPSIGGITGAVGEKGFGLLLLVLSLPSALPVPAPGYSTPFGIVIGLIALQMVSGRRTVWLPERLERVRIHPRIATRMIGAASRFLRKIERFIRPRQRWIRSRTGHAGLGLVIGIMACLMILPIPLTNTAPAIVVFLIGVGLAEEDGLLAMAAFAIGCAAVLLYGGIIYLLVTQGPEAVEGIKEWIKLRLGFSG